MLDLLPERLLWRIGRRGRRQAMELKVTATLGPASAQPEVITRLWEVSDRFRLNAGHLSAESLRTWLETVEGHCGQLGRIPPVVIDLQGAKMRIGELPVLERLPTHVTLVRRNEGSPDGKVIGVPHEELFKQVRIGETLTLNNGRIRLCVEATKPAEIRARVEQNGPLSGHQGINRADHPIVLREVGAWDLQAIEVAERFEFTELALSFVHDGTEAASVRALSNKRLIAKIERPEALDALPEIAARFDELWLCRGDLGEQAGVWQLGPMQARFESTITALGCPCFVAGGVLEHMTHFPQATRSEIVHLHDLSRSGWAGVVLSDETAIGEYPTRVADLIELLRRPPSSHV